MKNTSIEVHVKDTIIVMPDRFEYRLSVVKNYTNRDDEQLQQEQQVFEQFKLKD